MKNNSNTTRYLKGAVIATVLASPLLYSTHYFAKENDHVKVVNTEKHQPTLLDLDAQTKLDAIEPTMNLNTGFTDTFRTLTADGDVLHVSTKGRSGFSAGVGAQFKQEIFIDPEIADEFFSTPNYEKYIRGTVTRPSGLGTTTNKIEGDLWNKKTGLFNSETMYYEANGQKIVYKSPNFTVNLSSVTLQTDLYIDLGQWHKDTNRLVERKDSYSIRSRSSSADFITIGGKGSIVSVVNGESILDSWIENPVEDTTMYRLEEQPSFFYGNGLQDEKNEHETDYVIELAVNNQPYREIAMDEKGDWEFDFGTYLKDSDVVSARVKGTEKYTNNNGKVNTKYSDFVYAINETDIVPWKDWKVEAPAIAQAYEEEFLVQMTTPVQNRQLNRSYQLEVTLNGEEIYKKENIKDDVDVVVPYIDGLKDGDVVEATITGKQSGEADKTAKSQMVVVKEETDGYEDWEVQPAVFKNTFSAAETIISGFIPIQNHAGERTYDYELYVNDTLVDSEKDIEAVLKSYPFEAEVDELAPNDVVKVVVIGHQDKKADKVVETTQVVNDKTDWNDWKITTPTLNEVTDADHALTGNTGSQSTEFGRTYAIEAFVNQKSVGTIDVEADKEFKFDLPQDVKLAENDEVAIKVIGSQAGREDKYSEEAKRTVTEASNYTGWKINQPTLNSVKSTDEELTGSIGSQDTEFGRTYELEAFVNEESIGKIDAEAGKEFKFTLPKEVKLADGDEVAVQVIGYQADKKDKTSEKVTVKVEDTSDYDEWVVEEASLNELFEHDATISGHIPQEDSNFDRNYDLVVRINGEEITSTAVISDTDYKATLPKSIDLKENDEVSVQVIGHQPDKEDKASEETKMTVAKKSYPTTSKFEIGYWENFGLVYEGKIENEGWDLSDAARVTKTANLIDAETKQVAAKLDVANTDWYQEGRFNGYQIIASNDVLGALDEGTYTIQMTVAIDGEVVEETELDLTQMISRMGPIHDNYADLEKVVVKSNTVQPKVIGNRPGISITKNSTDSIKLVNKYWNKENQLVFEGYLDSETARSGSSKNLVVTNKDGEVVYEKASLTSAPSSWGLPTGISDEESFQAIIPEEFSDQAAFTFALVVNDDNGQELFNGTFG
ncbi:hypothetical protein [Candidatus Enterococcus murrayae]|uniref:Uncharacterized protein n=1 Tax=Candidatus Enterococcus murrayae TaxID=2815321 RepID=A0ABS3HEF4_9ENTE|nr:hypothetical protein [Enterococcus sp. MJM16]MBO0451839.1 hypothetical protein [Enterococcus sp. MJM16]